jgi:23S rRNA (uracil1939-C5)-methyltransferase
VLSCDVGEISILNELRIEKWVYGGDALARPGGRVVLVPFTMPGELVRTEVGDDIHVDLVEVIEPSPDRVAAPCPFFSKCGGCHYQHAPYEFQLARKVEILREQLRRVGKIDYQGEIDIISGPPLGYRNRSQFHIANGRIGYLAWRSHELVEVPGVCPISSPRVNATLALMQERLRDPKFPKFVREIEVFTNESAVQLNVLETDRPVARWFYDWFESSVALDYPTTHGTFRVSPHSFFQINRFLVDKMIDRALLHADGETALDLYSGVGLFTLPLSEKFKKVTAVESGATAVRDLQANAQRVEAVQSRAEDYLAKLDQPPDFVLADPPRAGLGKTVVAHLRRLGPRRITIVSCDPATLARDVAALKYKIERITLIDLFPQTYHVETIVDLTANGEERR